MKILITGTPGVGKSTLAKRIAETLGITHIDVTDYIKMNKLYESYDNELCTYIFDEKRIAKHLGRVVRKLDSVIIDTHSPGVASKINLDFIFLLKCDTKTLYERLADREYSDKKIQENIECECLNVVGGELEDIFEDIEPICVNGSEISDPDTTMVPEDVLKFVKKEFLRRSGA